MKKNKILAAVLILVFCIGLLTGCTNGNQMGKGDGYSIVCTIFPQYDWVKEVLGDNVSDFQLTLLLDNGVDLHNYQPTAEDMVKISACDLFIYVGGESDAWVEDALAEAGNQDMQVINLMDVLGDRVKEEEIVEGMETGEEAEEAEEEPEYDEHVWLSLKNAQVLVDAISAAIQNIDSENKEQYQEHADDYIRKLEALDREYEDAVAAGTKNTVLFGDRFPFRYLVNDYGIDYFAAFSGCSAETEASFETIIFLSEKVDELGLNSVLLIENSDKKIAETIIQNTADKNQNILEMNSMQAVTLKDVENGVTYLSIMEDNLETLKAALE